MPISLDGTLGINSSGNITAPYYYGNGALLTGITGGNTTGIASGNSAITFDGNGNAIINISGANIAAFTPAGIELTGNLNPSANVTYTLGNSTNQWKDLWVSNNTIYMNSIPINLTTATLSNGAVVDTLAVSSWPVIVQQEANVQFGNLDVAGNIVASGIVSAPEYNWSNGTPVISNTGNVDINNLVAAGDITGNAVYVGDVNNTTPGSPFFYANTSGTSFGRTGAGGISDLGGAISIGGTGGVSIFGVAGSEVNIGNPTGGNVNLTRQLVSTNSITATTYYGDGSNLTGINANYGDSNVTTLLASGNVTSNVITTGNISGNYILGNGALLTGVAPTYANANVTTLLASGNVTSNIITTANVAGNYFIGNGAFLTGVQTSVSQIPSVYFVAPANANGQAFSNAVLSGYQSNVDMTVFLNGILLENTYYTLSGDVLTINTYLRVNDSIDVIKQFAGNINNVSSGYGNSNVSGLLSSGTVNTNITTLANISGGYVLGNGALLTGLPASYTNSNVTTLLSTGINTNINTLANVNAAYFIGDGSFITNLPAGDYSNANVAAYLASGTQTANIVTTGNVNSGGMTINGNVIITGNANVQGNLTYNNITNLTTGNLVLGLGNNQAGINVNGGGMVVGNTAEAQFLYNQPAQTWDSNLGIDAAGNVTAPYFIGDGSALTNLPVQPGTYGNSNVATYLAGGAVSTNIVTTGNISGSYVLGNGALLTGMPAVYGNSNVSTYLASGAETANIITTGNVYGAYFVGDGSALTNMYGNTQVSEYLASATNTANISSTGNVNAGNVNTSGIISAVGDISSSGNLVVTGNIDINGSGELNILTNNNHGGANYAGIMTMTNTNGGATNPNKFLRLNQQGNLEIVNSGYTQTIFTLTDSGNLNVAGNISAPYFLGDGSQLTNLPAPANSARAYTLAMPADNSLSILLSNAGISDRDGAIYTIVNTGTAAVVLSLPGMLNRNNYGAGLIRSTSTLTLAVNTSITIQTFVANTSYYIMSYSGSSLIGGSAKIVTMGAPPANTDTLINWDPNIDPNNWWNATNHRFTPTIGGWYFCSLNMSVTSGSNQTQNVQIRKNDVSFAIQEYQVEISYTNMVNLTTMVYLNGTGDYINATIYPGASTNTGIDTGNGSNFSIYMIK